MFWEVDASWVVCAVDTFLGHNIIISLDISWEKNPNNNGVVVSWWFVVAHLSHAIGQIPNIDQGDSAIQRWQHKEKC